LWLRFFSTRPQAFSRFLDILRSSFFSLWSEAILVAAAMKRIRREARRRTMTPWLMSESSSFRNFLFFASAAASSVALAVLSFSA